MAPNAKRQRVLVLALWLVAIFNQLVMYFQCLFTSAWRHVTPLAYSVSDLDDLHVTIKRGYLQPVTS